MFDLLESQIVPLFYDRGPGGVPVGWVSRVKDAYASLGPRVTASRMVRDYVEEYYEPAAAAPTPSARTARPGVGRWPHGEPGSARRGRA